MMIVLLMCLVQDQGFEVKILFQMWLIHLASTPSIATNNNKINSIDH